MKKLISLLFVFSIAIFHSLPAHGIGYEDTSLPKVIFRLIVYLFISILVIAVTIYGTRLISKGFKGFASSKYIDILDAINIPGGAKLIITKINKKIYIIGVNNTSFNLIDIIEEDDFIEANESFDNYLSKYLNKENKYINTIGSLFSYKKKKDREDDNDEEKY